MPLPKVKPIEDAKANIEAAAGSIGAKYTRGLDTGKPWKSNAESDQAENLFAAKMQEVIAGKSRQKGISSVTEEDWKGAAKSKGAAVIGSNFRAAKDKWARNTQPYLNVIASTNLAEKTTDGVQNVQGRVVPIVAALIAKKKELKG